MVFVEPKGETEIVRRALDLVQQRFGHLDGLVLFLPADEKEEPRVAAVQGGPEDERLSHAALRDFCFHPTTRELLRACFGDLPGWQERYSWLRIKGPHASATPTHIDLRHFRARLALMRGLPPDEALCCFCGCEIDTVDVAACQRCGGAGIETAWVPLTPCHDPAQACVLWFGASPALCGAGDRVRFDGAEPHRAIPEGLSPTAPLRVSFDSRAVHETWLPGLARVDEALVGSWLERAAALCLSDARLFEAEGFHTRWMLELFGSRGREVVAAHPALQRFPSMRKARCRFRGASWRAPADWENVAELFASWMLAQKDSEARIVLITAISQFASKPQKFTVEKSGRAHKRHAAQALLAAQLVLMSTDWLIAPHRWHRSISGAMEVHRYCVLAHDALVAAGAQDHNAELYLLLAAVAGSLCPGDRGVLRAAQAFARRGDWARCRAAQRCKWRDEAFIELSCLLLRAWVCCL